MADQENQETGGTMKTVTISGKEFQINQPYAAGHVVTEAEAKALNQTRNENIRNNLAKAAKEEGFSQEDVSKYDAEYEFTIQAGGGRGLSPVERQARMIARDLLMDKFGIAKVKDIDELPQDKQDNFWTYVDKVMEMDEVKAQAKKIIDARTTQLDIDLG